MSQYQCKAIIQDNRIAQKQYKDQHIKYQHRIPNVADDIYNRNIYTVITSVLKYTSSHIATKIIHNVLHPLYLKNIIHRYKHELHKSII